MSGDESCADCGPDTTHHQQQSTDSTLTRRRNHSPKRGWRKRVGDLATLGAIALGPPLLALAYVFTDFSDIMQPNAAANLPSVLEPIAGWVTLFDTVLAWIMTAAIAVVLVCYVSFIVVFSYHKLR